MTTLAEAAVSVQIYTGIYIIMSSNVNGLSPTYIHGATLLHATCYMECLCQNALTIVHGFRPESENFEFGKKRIPSERASQEDKNGANFSFIAPSILE